MRPAGSCWQLLQREIPTLETTSIPSDPLVNAAGAGSKHASVSVIHALRVHLADLLNCNRPQNPVEVIVFPSLPPGSEEDNRWDGVFLPTLYKYLGSRQDPFLWQDEFAVETLQEIWNVVYLGRIKWNVRPYDLVHAKVR